MHSQPRTCFFYFSAAKAATGLLQLLRERIPGVLLQGFSLEKIVGVENEKRNIN